MGRDRFEITKARIIGGVVLFILAGLMAYLAIKTTFALQPLSKVRFLCLYFSAVSVLCFVSPGYLCLFLKMYLKRYFLRF